MKRIAIIGPGAIGGTVIVRLAQTRDHSIMVCARSAVPQFKLEAPEGTMTATPKVLTSPQQAKPVDWVFVATKVYDAGSAATWFEYLMGSDTRLAVMQNGVEHIDRFAPYLPVFRILPVVVDIPVEREAPGYFRQRRAGQSRFQQTPTGKNSPVCFKNPDLKLLLPPILKARFGASWR